MKTFKSFSEFKRVLAVGDKLHAIHHTGNFKCRDDQGKPIYEPRDLGVREVSIKQTNAFACKTERPDGTFKDSWIHYQGTEARVEGDALVFYDKDSKKKMLTYKFAE